MRLAVRRVVCGGRFSATYVRRWYCSVPDRRGTRGRPTSRRPATSTMTSASKETDVRGATLTAPSESATTPMMARSSGHCRLASQIHCRTMNPVLSLCAQTAVTPSATHWVTTSAAFVPSDVRPDFRRVTRRLRQTADGRRQRTPCKNRKEYAGLPVLLYTSRVLRRHDSFRASLNDDVFGGAHASRGG